VNVPEGFVGELVLSGPRVAEGYLVPPAGEDGFAVESRARVYWTGDHVRRRPDGDFVYVGRTDDQVKVRGFRVELQEVDAALLRHPGIRAAGVALQHLRGSSALVAHITPEPGSSLDIGEVRRYLLEQLPLHMVPTRIAVTTDIPLSGTQKIVRAAIAASFEDGSSPDRSPRRRRTGRGAGIDRPVDREVVLPHRAARAPARAAGTSPRLSARSAG